MALSRRVYPVDITLAVFNLLMAAVWVAGLGRWRYVPMLAAVHVVAAGLPWLLSRAPTLSTPVAHLRRVYPLLWLAAFWTEVDLVRRQLHDGSFDAVIIAAEQAIIGVHLHELWMPRMNSLWFSELLHFSYFAYYLSIVLPVAWLWFRRRDEDLMNSLFRMMAVYTICFFLFAIMPVDGPRHTGMIFEGARAEGFFARLVQLVAVEHGESLGAAFPSSHVAAAVTIAWVGWLYFPRPVFVLLVIEAIGVFLSTFYTQAHYAIDSVAGLVLALVVQAALVPFALRLAGWQDPGRAAETPTPRPAGAAAFREKEPG
jgi:membrane-associated phospholipid phosphatase